MTRSPCTRHFCRIWSMQCRLPWHLMCSGRKGSSHDGTLRRTCLVLVLWSTPLQYCWYLVFLATMASKLRSLMRLPTLWYEMEDNATFMVAGTEMRSLRCNQSACHLKPCHKARDNVWLWLLWMALLRIWSSPMVCSLLWLNRQSWLCWASSLGCNGKIMAVLLRMSLQDAVCVVKRSIIMWNVRWNESNSSVHLRLMVLCDSTEIWWHHVLWKKFYSYLTSSSQLPSI